MKDKYAELWSEIFQTKLYAHIDLMYQFFSQ